MAKQNKNTITYYSDKEDKIFWNNFNKKMWKTYLRKSFKTFLKDNENRFEQMEKAATVLEQDDSTSLR